MNYTIWGDSHLIGFMGAVENLGLNDRADLTFLPTPNVVNIKEIVSGAASSASLLFDGEVTPVDLAQPEQSVLVVVGNGNFAHFSVYERKGGLPPLWVYAPEIHASRGGGEGDGLIPSIPPVSMGLFRAVYAESVGHNLLYRHGFTAHYFKRFVKLILFIPPSPSVAFFSRQLCSEGYLEAKCLHGFRRAYAALFKQEVRRLGLTSVEINDPSGALELEDGTTAEEYLVDEVLQVHGNAAYWERRIRSSSLA